MFKGTESIVARQMSALERAQEHWQAQQEQERGGKRSKTPLTITISRQAGSPGTSVGREVGNRLGWPVYDDELLKIIAEEMGLRVSLLKSVDERKQHWLLESMQAMEPSLLPARGATYITWCRHFCPCQLTEHVSSLAAALVRCCRPLPRSECG